VHEIPCASKWAFASTVTISTIRQRRYRPDWGWITKFVDGNNFIGREALEAEKAAGIPRKLCGFTMIDKGIPRHGYEIVNEQNEMIGKVTSGTMSPVLKVGIGLGYVKPEYAKPGTPIYINIRNKPVKAEVVKPPFRK